jgi:hypothetical protein
MLVRVLLSISCTMTPRPAIAAIALLALWLLAPPLLAEEPRQEALRQMVQAAEEVAEVEPPPAPLLRLMVRPVPPKARREVVREAVREAVRAEIQREAVERAPSPGPPPWAQADSQGRGASERARQEAAQAQDSRRGSDVAQERRRRPEMPGKKPETPPGMNKPDGQDILQLKLQRGGSP